jgi:hypothetical protein
MLLYDIEVSTGPYNIIDTRLYESHWGRFSIHNEITHWKSNVGELPESFGMTLNRNKKIKPLSAC